MASPVKWIKIVTDIFDDEKVLMIEALPNADAIIVIWFKLLCLAGKANNSGVFLMNDKIAYTDEMLAAIFRRDLNTVRMALNVFEQYGMIEVVNNTITIPNWSKHQTLDAYEKKKERDRVYQQNRREKQKLLAEGKGGIKKSSDKSCDESSDSSLTSQKIAPLEEEREEEKEIEIELDIDKELEERKEDTTKPLSFPTPIHELLFNQFGIVSYTTWLSNLDITDDEIVIYATNKPFEDLIKKRYVDAIKALTGKTVSVKGVEKCG